jgi:carbonic anhydrase
MRAGYDDGVGATPEARAEAGVTPGFGQTNAVDDLLARNARFAERDHRPLPFLPRLGMCVVTCPDARVDPHAVLGLELGDAAVVRAAAGRISPIVLQQLLFLQAAGAARGQTATSLELVLMTHTDCGIVDLQGPEHRNGLAAFLGCTPEELNGKSVADPYAAVRVDIETLAAHPMIPASLSVTGLVYDVHTARATLVERRSPLRAGPSGADPEASPS